jgi:hypothetical protein
LLKKRLQTELALWLPAYAAGTARGWQRQVLKTWLDRDPAAREQLRQLEALQSNIRSQPQMEPSADVYLKLQAAIAQEAKPVARPARPTIAWVAAIVIALASLVLVWQARPPGISLEWSVQGELPNAFRVYRAPVAPDSVAPSQPFILLDEIEADEATAAYRFTDWLSLPGQNYVYLVEALDQSGQPTASQTVIGRGLDVLAGQLLTLAALGLLLLSLILIVRSSYRSYGPLFFQAV